MQPVGIYTDPICREHSAGVGHPERPERMDSVSSVLADLVGEPGITILSGRDASDEQIMRVHTAGHLDAVRASAGREVTVFDADTAANRHSFAAALRAAGSACAAVDSVCAGDARRAFVAARPPGHHAERDRAMGFCFFNTVAVAAEHARHAHGLQRVAVVDWDVHHGNGTMHHFAADPGVLFVSLHQYPLFPGTGRLEETGTDAGAGFSLNLPLSAGRSDNDYLYLFDSLIVPLLDRFAPQLVLVSAGYDAHERDPLGSMLLTSGAFAAMTQRLVSVAERSAEGRLVAVLEGGYSLAGLEAGLRETIMAMGAPAPERGAAAPAGHAASAARLVDSVVEELVERAELQLEPFWGSLRA